MRILYIDCFFGFDASMLLGALIDAGASPEGIKNDLDTSLENFKLNVTQTTRHFIECKKAYVSGNGCKTEFVKEINSKYPLSQGTDTASMEAVLSAIEMLNIEYIMCSDIGIKDGTDGEVLKIFESSGIETLPAEDSSPVINISDAVFLKSIVNECGPKPQMDIIAIGYGAGGEDEEKAHLVSVTIGSFNPENLFETVSTEEIVSML